MLFKSYIGFVPLAISISPIYVRNDIVTNISPSSAIIRFFTKGTGILHYVYAPKGVPVRQARYKELLRERNLVLERLNKINKKKS